MPLSKTRSLRLLLFACVAVVSSILLYAVFILKAWHLRLLPFTALRTDGLPMTCPTTCDKMADAANNTPVADTLCVALVLTLGIPATLTYISNLSEWSFDKSRDARDYTLTADQCNTAFPGLYAEIDGAVAYRKKIGRLAPEDVDISLSKQGLVRALIADQQLYVIQETVSGSEYDSPRALAILHAIHRAMITSAARLPDIEFSFSVSDIADEQHLGQPVWALARTPSKQERWLMSDFGYWSWPLDLVGGYDQIRLEIADIEIDISEKKPQVVWRGAVKTNKFRRDLIKVTNGKTWADVKGIAWQDATELKAQDHGKAISIPEHCLYQFLIQTKGHSYSGRGKYLQNCNSVVIIPKRNWIEPHHSLLKSGENFVEVKEDFSDLEETILSLLADPTKAR
ncbi:glycosyl transferase family 90-domain-containing protein [Rhexocercosporidium sp. MPI-PUGE-AT-0058]|nr:glycosyl transferase family 90-domain-containing protein [Rhexocercosporidium sp. MPI-PUGE-AT-0058]